MAIGARTIYSTQWDPKAHRGSMVAELIPLPAAGCVLVHCPQYFTLLVVNYNESSYDTINLQTIVGHYEVPALHPIEGTTTILLHHGARVIFLDIATRELTRLGPDRNSYITATLTYLMEILVLTLTHTA